MVDKPLRLEDKDLFNVDEVAAILGMRRWTLLREYIYTGKLKAHKIGNGTGKRGTRRRWRIWRQDVIDFVNKTGNVNAPENKGDG